MFQILDSNDLQWAFLYLLKNINLSVSIMIKLFVQICSTPFFNVLVRQCCITGLQPHEDIVEMTIPCYDSGALNNLRFHSDLQKAVFKSILGIMVHF